MSIEFGLVLAILGLTALVAAFGVLFVSDEDEDDE